MDLITGSTGGLAIVGMSVGNGYFKRSKIDELLNYTSENYDPVSVMITDKPAIHTYLAVGYSEKEAKRKARLNGNTLRNHCNNTIDSLVRNNTRIIDWDEDIFSQECYVEEYGKIKNLYEQDPFFREDARETTHAVLQRKIELRKTEIELDVAIDEGVEYLLEELAFLLISPRLFGVDKVKYIYYRKWPIFNRLISGNYAIKKRTDLECVIVR